MIEISNPVTKSIIHIFQYTAHPCTNQQGQRSFTRTWANKSEHGIVSRSPNFAEVHIEKRTNTAIIQCLHSMKQLVNCEPTIYNIVLYYESCNSIFSFSCSNLLQHFPFLFRNSVSPLIKWAPFVSLSLLVTLLPKKWSHVLCYK